MNLNLEVVSMDFETYMTNSLSALLKKNEHLQLAFCGKLHTGSIARPHEYYCFFGLVGNDLLIVNYSPLLKKNGFSVRLPLNTNKVEITKSILSDKFILNFQLNSTDWQTLEKFKIGVKSEHSKIKSQRENVTAFLSYIEKRVNPTP